MKRQNRQRGRLERGTLDWWLWQHGNTLDWLAVLLFNLIILAITWLQISRYR